MNDKYVYLIFEHSEDHNSINPYQTDIICVFDTEHKAKERVDELIKFNLENRIYGYHYNIKPVIFYS